MKPTRSCALRLLLSSITAPRSFSLGVAELLKLGLQKRIKSKEKTDDYRATTVTESWDAKQAVNRVAEDGAMFPWYGRNRNRQYPPMYIQFATSDFLL